MLGKLFKHEFKATLRIFLPMYALLIVVSLVNKWIRELQNTNSAFGGILVVVPIILYVGIIMAILFVSIMMLIQRFYKNLLGDEGYLTHTLPVKPWQHITCKLSTSSFWNLMSTIMVTLSILLVTVRISEWGNLWKDFQSLLASAGTVLGGDANAVFWGALLLGFVYLIEKTLMVYAGLGIGQCAAKRKVAFSIAMIVALNIAEQILTFAVLRVLPVFLPNFPIFMRAASGTDFTALFQWSLGCAVVFGVIYAVITNWMLKRRLNLA